MRTCLKCTRESNVLSVLTLWLWYSPAYAGARARRGGGTRQGVCVFITVVPITKLFALCLPTFSHLLIVNKPSLSLSSLSLAHSLALVATYNLLESFGTGHGRPACKGAG